MRPHQLPFGQRRSWSSEAATLMTQGDEAGDMRQADS